MMIRKTLDSRDVLMFVDIHGHSRKKNAFMYGCYNQKLPNGIDRLKERIFPMIFDRCHDSFNFKDCCFIVQKDRETTGRVVVWKEFNIINSFTLEASFCGSTSGKFSDCHFTPNQYRDIGKTFCTTLLEFSEPN